MTDSPPRRAAIVRSNRLGHVDCQPLIHLFISQGWSVEVLSSNEQATEATAALTTTYDCQVEFVSSATEPLGDAELKSQSLTQVLIPVYVGHIAPMDIQLFRAVIAKTALAHAPHSRVVGLMIGALSTEANWYALSQTIVFVTNNRAINGTCIELDECFKWSANQSTPAVSA